MNIFFLSWVIAECCSAQCDQHVVKIIVEIAQMLYAAHHVLHGDEATAWKRTAPNGGYRKAQANNPMAIWARATPANYHYAARIGMQLCRYGNSAMRR
jgi:hypothetical protein